MRVFPLLLVSLAVVALPSSALASTAAIRADGVLYVTAKKGEVNNVSVTQISNTAWSVGDTAGLTAGPACTRIDRTTAQCAAPGAQDRRPEVLVDLKDRSDRATAYDNGGGPLVTIEGGAGQDVISNAVTGTARVLGQEGDDTITAGPHGGSALLEGGAGDDDITLGDFAFFASLDGGPGDDRIERIPTGSGPGGPDPEQLDGGGGDDVILGTYNPEIVRGGPGDDRINGGGGGDEIDCGRGWDRYAVFSVFAVDLIRPNCELPF
jgi:Ca2+-binding RTX toxin-like protein